MNSINLMIEEHKNIKRMLNIVKKMCFILLKHDNINFEDFNKAIDFIKHYADEHHHGKEEQILFKEMVEKLGTMGKNLITHGMLVEHDYGRLYIQQLKAALEKVKQGDEVSKLDIIANAVGYTNLLERHISKEDDLVYKYGANNLSEAVLEDINNRTDIFEQQAETMGIQRHYLDLIAELEEKYK